MSEHIEARRHPDGGWTIETHKLAATIDAREDGSLTIEVAPHSGHRLDVKLAEPQPEA